MSTAGTPQNHRRYQHPKAPALTQQEIFFGFNTQIKRRAFKIIESLKIQPATGFQVHFKIMKHLYVVGNSNLHQKRAELSPVLCPRFIYRTVSCWVQVNTPNFAVINIQNEVDKDKRILGNSKNSFLTTSFNKRSLFKILKIPVFLKSHFLEYCWWKILATATKSKFPDNRLGCRKHKDLQLHRFLLICRKASKILYKQLIYQLEIILIHPKCCFTYA